MSNSLLIQSGPHKKFIPIPEEEGQTLVLKTDATSSTGLSFGEETGGVTQQYVDDAISGLSGGHAAVSLSGTPDYLTLDEVTQTFTLNQVDLSTDVIGQLADANLDAATQTSLASADSAVQPIEINTLAGLNAIVGDATLVDQTYVDTAAGNATGTTNLSYTPSPTDGTVASDTGTDATLTLATGVNAGLMAPADFTKLGAISGTNTGDQDLSGLQPKPAEGQFVDGDKTKLDGLVSNVTTDLAYTPSPTDGTVTSSDGTDATLTLADGTNAGLMAPADFTKLGAIDAGATDDQTPAEILTAIQTVDGTGSGLDADLLDGLEASAFQLVSEKSQANGYASLDGSGKVPASELPSYVDDVLEYADQASFPGTGESSKIYVAIDTGSIYRWTGSTYVEVSADAGAPVSSVNTLTGAVVLDADDIDDAATAHKFVTAGDLTNLSNLSGTNTGDQDLSTYQLKPSEGAFENGDKTKLDSLVSNVTTDLAYTASPTNGIVTSSDGTDATLPLADGTNAGLMAPADFTKLGAYVPYIQNAAAIQTEGFTAVLGETHLIDTSSGGFTVDLPAIASGQGRIAFDFVGTGGQLTIDPAPPEQIEGKNSIKLAHGHNTIENDGTEWKVIQRSGKNPTRLDPAQITSNQDGYAPADWDHVVTHLYIDSDASREIQGFEENGFVDMDQIIVTNDGSNDIIIKHDTSTTDTNKVLVDGGTDFILGPNQSGILMRDDDAGRWRFYGISRDPVITDLTDYVTNPTASADSQVAVFTADGVVEGTANFTYDGSILDVKNGGTASSMKLYCEVGNAHFTELKSAPHVNYTGGSKTFVLPAVDGSSGHVLQTDGAGNLSFVAPSGGGSGHTIEDEGVDLAQRGSLNFVGAGVTATDDAGNDRTIVTISGGGGTVQGTDATYDIRSADQGLNPSTETRGEGSVDLQTFRSNYASGLVGRSANIQIAGSNYSAILSGQQNLITSSNSSDPDFNTNATGSVILGGKQNEISATYGAIIGGSGNTCSSTYSSILGGIGNSVFNAPYSIAGGSFVAAAHTGCFAFGSNDDGTLVGYIAETITNADYQVAFKAAGGLRLIDGNEAAGYVLTCDAAGVGTWQAAGGGGGGGHTIQDEGVAETTRTNLNFVGTGIDVTDDAGNDATVVTIDPIPVEINDLTDVNTSGSETLSITGTLSPDATGTYTLAGTHNGENYYTNGTYFVWNNGAGTWYLDNATSVQGGDETATWTGALAFGPVNDNYNPLTGATGNATVTLNPAAGPAEGDVLSWDDTAGEWVTGAPAVGGGSVASDTIWDVAGDLAVGSGADTASRLAIGTEGQVLTVSGGAVAWGAGGGGSGGTVQTPSTLQIRATDEGTTAGNARAANSVDLQTARSAATQIAGGSYSTISGGLNNTASGTHSTVSGGYDNTASDNSSTVSGGRDNDAIGSYCTVGGGVFNTASGIYYSTVSGGDSNTASGYASTVSGGAGNTASDYFSTVSGGSGNTASSFYSTVSGGRDNIADGDYSWAGGKFASTGLFDNTFAWNDGGAPGNLDIAATPIPNAANQFAIKAAGGLRLIDGNEAAGYVLTCDAAGVGTWQAAGGGGGSGHTIEDEGVDLAQRGSLNFVGAGVTATDDAGNDRTIVTISGGGSGGTVQTPTTLQIRATDEGTVAGNTRGANSVDLQTKRDLATQIALGQFSTISGGSTNTASNYHSTIGGGRGNTANNYSTVSGGRDNDAIGSYCTVGGGYNNDASDNSSTVSGGYNNDAISYASTVSGGTYNTASNYYSTVSGGTGNTASGYYSTVSGGKEAKADKYGQQAYSAGQFAAQGDAQTSLMVVRNQTSTATQGELFLNGTTQRMTIADDTTWFFEINLVARRTDVNDESAIYKFEGAIDRNTGAASTTLVGTVAKTVYSEDTPAWDATVEADTTNGALVIKVTGESPKVINWVARVETTEVTG